MSNNQILSAAKAPAMTTTQDLASNRTAQKFDTATDVTENMITSITDNDSASNPVATSIKTVSNPPRSQFTRQRRQLAANQRQQCARDASLHLVKLQQRLPANPRIGLYYDDFGELPTQPLLKWCLRLSYQPYLPVVGSLGNDDKHLRFVPPALCSYFSC